MREQKGITLIALVITIIVLLILAGVTIAMLVGQNGILSNANLSSCQNAFRGADEQMRLAYMAVRTEIMAKTVDNSTYNAATQAASADLKAIVQKDLNNSATDTTKWTVKVSSDYKYIYIRFQDNAIDQGLIDNTKDIDGSTTVTPAKTPRYDLKVYGKIDLTPSNGQSANYSFDVVEPSNPSFSS